MIENNYLACHSPEKTRDYVKKVTLAPERSAGENLTPWSIEALHPIQGDTNDFATTLGLSSYIERLRSTQ